MEVGFVVNQLHSRLRLLREKSGLTQAQLAKILLLPRVTYTHYELGKRTPDLDMIIRMARHFDVTVDYLVGNSDLSYLPVTEYYPEAQNSRLVKRVADADRGADYEVSD
jgi:transcriptional regulator with XRE-family HTH domain